MKNIIKLIAHASFIVPVAGLFFATNASAALGDVIVNEWNAVGPNKFLEDSGSDTFFGQVEGNGGDWIELVVIANGADLRGHQIHWRNDDGSGKEGYLTFSNSSKWNGGGTPATGLKAGTIIVIRKGAADSFPDASTLACDMSVSNGSWDNIIQVNSNGTYVTESGNAFQVDNDGWRARILDNASPTRGVVQTWVGEPPYDSGDTGNNCTACTGSGISSQEVGKLEEDPSASAATNPTAANYNDGDSSTYGDPNLWNSGANEQCFAALTSCGGC